MAQGGDTCGGTGAHQAGVGGFFGWELGFFELLSVTGEFPARFSGEKFPLGAAGSLLVLGKGVLAVPLWD